MSELRQRGNDAFNHVMKNVLGLTGEDQLLCGLEKEGYDSISDLVSFSRDDITCLQATHNLPGKQVKMLCNLKKWHDNKVLQQESAVTIDQWMALDANTYENFITESAAADVLAHAGTADDAGRRHTCSVGSTSLPKRSRVSSDSPKSSVQSRNHVPSDETAYTELQSDAKNKRNQTSDLFQRHCLGSFHADSSAVANSMKSFELAKKAGWVFGNSPDVLEAAAVQIIGIASATYDVQVTKEKIDRQLKTIRIMQSQTNNRRKSNGIRSTLACQIQVEDTKNKMPTMTTPSSTPKP